MTDRLEKALDRGDIHDVDLQSVAIPGVRLADPIGNGRVLRGEIAGQRLAALLLPDPLPEPDGMPDHLAVLAVVELRRRVGQDL